MTTSKHRNREMLLKHQNEIVYFCNLCMDSIDRNNENISHKPSGPNYVFFFIYFPPVDVEIGEDVC